MNIMLKELFHLSSVQEEIYLEQLLHPDSAHLTHGCRLRVVGEIHPSSIESALGLMSDKWPALRARIVEEHGSVFQSFESQVALPLQFFDCSNEVDPQTAAVATIQQQVDQQIDLFGNVLWRVAVVKIAERQFDIGTSFHYMIADGYTARLFTREFVAAYNSVCQAENMAFREDTSYFQFIEDSSRYRRSEAYQRDREVWLAEFQEVPEPVLTPISQEKPQRHRCVTYESPIPRALYHQLSDQLKHEGATVQSFFIAILAIYLHRCFGPTELVLGITLHNRNKVSYKNTLGMFSSALPLRVKISQSMTCHELIKSIGKKLKRLYRHQRYPLSDLNHELRLAASGRVQLFDLTLSFESQEVEYPLVKERYLLNRVDERSLLLPLTVRICDAEKASAVKLITVANLTYFDEDLAPWLSERLVSMVRAACHDLNQPIATLPTTALTEHQLLLSVFNDTYAPWPQGQCIQQVFEAQVAEQPDATALICGAQDISYRLLNRQANQLAHRLVADGVGPDCLVGLCLERGVNLVIGLLAILKAGGTCVPIDPCYPRDNIAEILEDSGLRWLLTEQSLACKLPRTSQRIFYLDIKATYKDQPTDYLPPIKLALKPTHLAYLVYSQGADGKPVGVMLEHRNLINLLTTLPQSLGFKASDVLLAPPPLSFARHTVEILLPLLVGAQLAFASHEQLDSAAALRALIAKRKVTAMLATPEILQQVMCIDAQTVVNKLKLFCTDGVLSAHMQDRLLTKSGIECWYLYGPTETALYSGVAKMQPFYDTFIERPIANTQLHVLDEQHCLVPLGVVGELYIGGAGIARGYWQRPQLNDLRFIHNPYYDPTDQASSECLYRTGEQVRRRADGSLELIV